MSFSVVYKVGRSLQTVDIACFDKQQFEVWTSGLQVFDYRCRCIGQEGGACHRASD